MKEKSVVFGIALLVIFVILVLFMPASESGYLAGRKLYKNGFDVNTTGDCGAWDEGDGYAPSTCGTAELGNSEWLRMDINWTTWNYSYAAVTKVEVIQETGCAACYYQVAMRREGTSTWDYCYAYPINPLKTIFQCEWDVPSPEMDYDKLQIRGWNDTYPPYELDPWHLHVVEATLRPPPPTSTPRPLP